MTHDPHRIDISVGDRVVVREGVYAGSEGRVVVRHWHDAFGVIGVTFEVDFEDHPDAYGYTRHFLPSHLERI